MCQSVLGLSSGVWFSELRASVHHSKSLEIKRAPCAIGTVTSIAQSLGESRNPHQEQTPICGPTMGNVSEQSNAVALADIDRPIASTDSYAHLSALLRKIKIKGTYQDAIHSADLLIHIGGLLESSMFPLQM